MAKSQARVKQGKKLAAKAKRTGTKAFDADKTKWTKFAKDWFKVKRKSKARIGKRPLTVFGQWLEHCKKKNVGKGDTWGLPGILWAKFAGDYKAKKAPKKKSTSKKSTSTKSALSPKDILAKAKTYNRKKVKQGEYSKLKAKFGKTQTDKILKKAKSLAK